MCSEASASTWASESLPSSASDLMDKVLIFCSANSGSKPRWNEVWLEIFQADSAGIDLLSSDLWWCQQREQVVVSVWRGKVWWSSWL